MYTIFFRFLTESFLFDFVSLSIDFKLQFENEPETQYNLDFVLLICAVLFVVFKLYVCFLIVNAHARQTSELWFLFNGLSTERNRIMIYFVHFIFIRVFIAGLVMLTEVIDSFDLVLSLFIGQILSFLFHVYKLYSSKILCFQIFFIREGELLFESFILFYL